MRGFVLIKKKALFGSIKYIQHSDSNAFMFVSLYPARYLN